MTANGPDPKDHQMVFIGGLHRSGTSFLARMLAAHPHASGLRGTNASEDEGQHVQSVYETAQMHGGPGRFAFDPAMHMTEESPGATPETARRLLDDWGRYLDMSKRVLVEKSPPNLIKARWLQAVFPGASFVMVLRHPIAVACATKKWSKTSYKELVRHWATAYEIMADDVQHLHRVITVRYEDVVADPATEYDRVLAFLGLESTDTKEDVQTGVNEKYYEMWERAGPIGRRSERGAVATCSARVQRFGYSLIPPYNPGRLPPELAAGPNSHSSTE